MKPRFARSIIIENLVNNLLSHEQGEEVRFLSARPVVGYILVQDVGTVPDRVVGRGWVSESRAGRRHARRAERMRTTRPPLRPLHV